MGGESRHSEQPLKRATCPSRVCLRTSMYVKHPVARGFSLTGAQGPLSWPLGSYCNPGILVTVTRSSRAVPRYLTDLYH